MHGNDLNLGRLPGKNDPLKIPASLRALHTYICGSTGTGKSKLLEYLIKQDIKAHLRTGCGLLLIDPHGSLYSNILKWCTWHNVSAPILPIDLRRKDWCIGYNLLRNRQNADPGVITSYMVNAMAYVWGESGLDNTPHFARWGSHLVRTLYENGLTLAEVDQLTSRSDIRSRQIRHALAQQVKDPGTVSDLVFLNELNAFQVDAQLTSTINRFHSFTKIEAMKAMLGQQNVSLDLRKVLDEGWIVLVNLSPEGGNVTDENGALFATLLLTDLWTTARERGKPDDARDVKPFYVYIDEFQNFVTPTIAKQLDEARGYGLHLTMSHQFPKQLLHQGAHGEQVLDSIMANARNKVAFQLGGEDLKRMAEEMFMGTMNPDKIKLALYSTKVMGYREQYCTSYGGSQTVGSSRTSGSSTGSGSNSGGTEHFSDDGDPMGTGASHGDSTNEGASESESDSESSTRSWTKSPMLIPQMGKELSSVQFECLQEQMYRNMAVLFDQKQRHALVRLAESSLPVSFETPTLTSFPSPKEMVDDYSLKLLKESGWALPVSEALKQVEDRRKDFEARYLQRTAAEPATWETRTEN